MEPVWWGIIVSTFISIISLLIAIYSLKQTKRLAIYKYGPDIRLQVKNDKVFIKNIGRGSAKSVSCGFVDFEKNEFHLPEIDVLESEEEIILKTNRTFYSDIRVVKQDIELKLKNIVLAKVTLFDAMNNELTFYYNCLIPESNSLYLGTDLGVAFLPTTKNDYKFYCESFKN